MNVNITKLRQFTQNSRVKKVIHSAGTVIKQGGKMYAGYSMAKKGLPPSYINCIFSQTYKEGSKAANKVLTMYISAKFKNLLNMLKRG